MQVTPLSALFYSICLIGVWGGQPLPILCRSLLSLLSFTPSATSVCKVGNLSEHVAVGAVVNLYLTLQIAVTPMVCIFHHPASNVICVSFKQYWWFQHYLDSSTCRKCQKRLVLDSTSKMKSDQLIIEAVLKAVHVLPGPPLVWQNNEWSCVVCAAGLSNFCLVCGHGGHTGHMMEWFVSQTVCPTGCGCSCMKENFFAV